ncbi:helicase [Elysia marginata]|uniref:Helicase n=1 Tax=Elysia marginata TaxID=1093978 RepID=A0AAV4GU84_9GAST|nr:helicase [Elysia marginata]
MGKPTLLVAGNLAGAVGRSHPHEIPIEYIVGWLKKRMPEFGGKGAQSLASRTLIVRSETGSGKSTVLPAYLFRLLRSKGSDKGIRLAGPGVICTQPRILTAQTLARDQAADDINYPDLVMGVTIGYQTGPINEKPASGLIYATAGSLLAQLRTMPDADIIARYRFIIVDEAHERSLDIDSLLLRLKIFLRRNLGNPWLPFVLLASATLPVEKYAQYFGLGPENIIEVTGRAYGVAQFFPKTGTNDYPQEAVRTALELHTTHSDDSPERADILVFMPGKREIDMVVELLTKANWKFRDPESKVGPFLLLAISREEILTQARDYRLIKAAPADLRVPSTTGNLLRPVRRIIVSTVVAETGLTIETLKYVIDCGWSRTQEVYYPGGVRGIITRPAPQSRIKQRMGRAGRKFPGEFYPLYTKNVYEMLAAEQPPEVITEGIAPIFLDIVAATMDAQVLTGGGSVFRVSDIDMLDPPPVDALADSLEKAISFGYLRATDEAVAAGGHSLSRLGQTAARFTLLGMPQTQTLLAGYLWQVSIRDLALIVALYEQRDALLYWKPPPGQNQQARAEEARQKALRAGLPDYLVKPPPVLLATARSNDNNNGGAVGGNDQPPAEAEEYYYRARLLISDEFIEALLAFEGFLRALDRALSDLGSLLDWCDRNGIDFQGAVILADLRETVINELLTAGLNPFWGEEHRLADAPPEAFFDTVVRLKYCIYAGLRFSTLTHDTKTGTYRERGGKVVEVPEVYADAVQSRLRGLGASVVASARPRRLVTNAVRLRGAKRDQEDKWPPFLYRLVPGLVSVLDGYVDIDATFGDPRFAA